MGKGHRRRWQTVNRKSIINRGMIWDSQRLGPRKSTVSLKMILSIYINRLSPKIKQDFSSDEYQDIMYDSFVCQSKMGLVPMNYNWSIKIVQHPQQSMHGVECQRLTTCSDMFSGFQIKKYYIQHPQSYFRECDCTIHETIRNISHAKLDNRGIKAVPLLVPWRQSDHLAAGYL